MFFWLWKSYEGMRDWYVGWIFRVCCENKVLVMGVKRMKKAEN